MNAITTFENRIRTRPQNIRQIEQKQLIMGMVEDSKPLLLDMSDPQPGAILVTGDQGAGKTRFLMSLIKMAAMSKQPGKIDFVLLTKYPRDFDGFDGAGYLSGVWNTALETTADALYELACTVEDGSNRKPTVFMVDGIESIFAMDQITQENIAYILEEGAQTGIWSIVTANSQLIIQYPDLLKGFRTRIYGHVSDVRIARALSPNSAPMATLAAGYQFCIRENRQWLKFWIPTPGLPQ